MKFIKKLSTRFSTIAELLVFFWKNKLWWMMPMIIVLLIVGILIIFANASPLAPFIYPLF